MRKITGLIFLIFSFTANAAHQPTAAKHGMVVSEQHLASAVGRDILRAGGNAIDAAVAVGYALAVVDPCCGNLGGGGLMTIHLHNGQNIFLNFREKAPLAAKSTLYLDAHGNVIPNLSTHGYLAVAVPGTVLGLETALKKYGTMTRAQVIQPAIKLAEQGFVLTASEANLLRSYANDFRAQPNVAKIFLQHDQPYRAGEKLVQMDLANTLKLISAHGADVFYHGKIAATIVHASQTHGGILAKKDFANYTVKEATPIHCRYRGFYVISAPPPSSGGVTLCEILNIVSGYSLHAFGFHSVPSVHYTAEAMRYAFADRNNKLGDPDFVRNPVTELLDEHYAAAIRKKISPERATSSQDVSRAEATPEGIHTTHYSVLDREGNAVAVTYTINSLFGAKVIAGDTGFFLNDEMDDFAAKPGVPNKFGLVQGTANAIQPGKRPLSSMTPTIVLHDGHIVLVLGSPGGPRIITSTLQALMNVIDFGMTIQQAVDAPRFHQQWLPDVITLEPKALSLSVQKKLNALGYQFVVEEPWSAVEAIQVDPVSGMIYGANDVRQPAGAAIGY